MAVNAQARLFSLIGVVSLFSLQLRPSVSSKYENQLFALGAFIKYTKKVWFHILDPKTPEEYAYVCEQNIQLRLIDV